MTEENNDELLLVRMIKPAAIAQTRESTMQTGLSVANEFAGLEMTTASIAWPVRWDDEENAPVSLKAQSNIPKY